MSGNRLPFAGARRGVATKNLNPSFILSLVAASAITVIEPVLLRPEVEVPAKLPAANHAPIDAPAFVMPPRPPSDVLVGAKIRIG